MIRPPAAPGIQATEAERLREACHALEGVFLSQLMAVMRETVPDSGLLDGGQGEEQFTQMFDQQVADSAARRMGRGLGEALYRQLAPRANLGAAAPEPAGRLEAPKP